MAEADSEDHSSVRSSMNLRHRSQPPNQVSGTSVSNNSYDILSQSHSSLPVRDNVVNESSKLVTSVEGNLSTRRRNAKSKIAGPTSPPISPIVALPSVTILASSRRNSISSSFGETQSNSNSQRSTAGPSTQHIFVQSPVNHPLPSPFPGELSKPGQTSVERREAAIPLASNHELIVESKSKTVSVDTELTSSLSVPETTVSQTNVSRSGRKKKSVVGELPVINKATDQFDTVSKLLENITETDHSTSSHALSDPMLRGLGSLRARGRGRGRGGFSTMSLRELVSRRYYILSDLRQLDLEDRSPDDPDYGRSVYDNDYFNAKRIFDDGDSATRFSLPVTSGVSAETDTVSSHILPSAPPATANVSVAALSEPKRNKTHWDFLLEEAQWLAEDFASERRRKQKQISALSRAIKREQERKEKEKLDMAISDELRRRKRAARIASHVGKFWGKVDNFVIYKQKSRLEAMKRMAMDKHLHFFVGQTERYTSMIVDNIQGGSESLSNTLVPVQRRQYPSKGSEIETHHQESSSAVDTSVLLDSESLSEFDDHESEESYSEKSEEDDEETIEAEERLRESRRRRAQKRAARARGEDVSDSDEIDDEGDDNEENEEADEMAALHREADMDVEELRRLYAPPDDYIASDSESELDANTSSISESLKSSSTSESASSSSGKIVSLGDLNADDDELDDESEESYSEKSEEDDEETIEAEERLRESRRRRAQKRAARARGEDVSDSDEIDDEGDDNEENEEADEMAALHREADMDVEELRRLYAPPDDYIASDSESELRSDNEVAPKTEGEQVDSSTIIVSRSLSNDSRGGGEVGGSVSSRSVQVEVATLLSPDEASNRSTKRRHVSFQLDDSNTSARPRRTSSRLKSSSPADSSIVTSSGAAASPAPLDEKPLTHYRCDPPFLLRNGHLMRPYQREGLDWLASMHDRRLNGILADEMGLGKTLQTISLLAHLASTRSLWGPHLIVVPTSTLLNWETEFKRWAPGFKVVTYYGSTKERKLKRAGWTKPNAFHVCITSYQMALADASILKRKQWYYMVLDEAHYIKNYNSQRWQSLLTFSSRRRLLLTGTPLQNSLLELWSLMHFLMPHLFRSQAEFKTWFAKPLTQHVEGTAQVDQLIVRRLHAILRPFVLRRLKAEVATQMPKKYEHIITCRMSQRQRYLYEDFMSRSSTRASLAGGNYMSMMNVLMQLRKVCNHPDLFETRSILSPLSLPQLCLQVPRLVVDPRAALPSWQGPLTQPQPLLCSLGVNPRASDSAAAALIYASQRAFGLMNAAPSMSHQMSHQSQQAILLGLTLALSPLPGSLGAPTTLQQALVALSTKQGEFGNSATAAGDLGKALLMDFVLRQAASSQWGTAQLSVLSPPVVVEGSVREQEMDARHAAGARFARSPSFASHRVTLRRAPMARTLASGRAEQEDARGDAFSAQSDALLRAQDALEQLLLSENDRPAVPSSESLLPFLDGICATPLLSPGLLLLDREFDAMPAYFYDEVAARAVPDHELYSDSIVNALAREDRHLLAASRSLRSGTSPDSPQLDYKQDEALSLRVETFLARVQLRDGKRTPQSSLQRLRPVPASVGSEKGADRRITEENVTLVELLGASTALLAHSELLLHAALRVRARASAAAARESVARTNRARCAVAEAQRPLYGWGLRRALSLALLPSPVAEGSRTASALGDPVYASLERVADSLVHGRLLGDEASYSESALLPPLEPPQDVLSSGEHSKWAEQLFAQYGRPGFVPPLQSVAYLRSAATGGAGWPLVRTDRGLLDDILYSSRGALTAGGMRRLDELSSAREIVLMEAQGAKPGARALSAAGAHALSCSLVRTALRPLLRSHSIPLSSQGSEALLTAGIAAAGLQSFLTQLSATPASWDCVSPTLRAMVRSQQERYEQLLPLLHTFTFVIPRAASAAPFLQVGLSGGLTAHGASALLPAGSRARIAAASDAGLALAQRTQALTHATDMRMHLSFPDRKLVQYDCGKLQALDALLRERKAGGHKCLIFSQMSRMLDVLETFLNLHDYSYLRLDGATRVEERQRLMDRFNSDPKVFCFILSTRSGGLGINLVGADTVIFYDSDWNPSMDAQAQDRAHRIGQTRDVHIYRLITESSIEENILLKARQKRQLQQLSLEEGQFTMGALQNLSVKDLIGGTPGVSDVLDDTPLIGALEQGDGKGKKAKGDSQALLKAMASAEDDDDRNATRVAVKEAEDEDVLEEGDAEVDADADVEADIEGDADAPSTKKKLASKAKGKEKAKYAAAASKSKNKKQLKSKKKLDASDSGPSDEEEEEGEEDEDDVDDEMELEEEEEEEEEHSASGSESDSTDDDDDEVASASESDTASESSSESVSDSESELAPEDESDDDAASEPSALPSKSKSRSKSVTKSKSKSRAKTKGAEDASDDEMKDEVDSPAALKSKAKAKAKSKAKSKSSQSKKEESSVVRRSTRVAVRSRLDIDLNALQLQTMQEEAALDDSAVSSAAPGGAFASSATPSFPGEKDRVAIAVAKIDAIVRELRPAEQYALRYREQYDPHPWVAPETIAAAEAAFHAEDKEWELEQLRAAQEDDEARAKADRELLLLSEDLSNASLNSGPLAILSRLDLQALGLMDQKTAAELGLYPSGTAKRSAQQEARLRAYLQRLVSPACLRETSRKIYEGTLLQLRRRLRERALSGACWSLRQDGGLHYYNEDTKEIMWETPPVLRRFLARQRAAQEGFQGLHRLPQLGLAIMSFLDGPDRARLGATCKSWDALHRHPLLMRFVSQPVVQEKTVAVGTGAAFAEDLKPEDSKKDEIHEEAEEPLAGAPPQMVFDSLQRAVRHARPMETVVIGFGAHFVPAPLVLDKPIRLLSQGCRGCLYASPQYRNAQEYPLQDWLVSSSGDWYPSLSLAPPSVAHQHGLLSAFVDDRGFQSLGEPLGLNMEVSDCAVVRIDGPIIWRVSTPTASLETVSLPVQANSKKPKDFHATEQSNDVFVLQGDDPYPQLPASMFPSSSSPGLSRFWDTEPYVSDNVRLWARATPAEREYLLQHPLRNADAHMTAIIREYMGAGSSEAVQSSELPRIRVPRLGGGEMRGFTVRNVNPRVAHCLVIEGDAPVRLAAQLPDPLFDFSSISSSDATPSVVPASEPVKEEVVKQEPAGRGRRATPKKKSSGEEPPAQVTVQEANSLPQQHLGEYSPSNLVSLSAPLAVVQMDMSSRAAAGAAVLLRSGGAAIFVAARLAAPQEASAVLLTGGGRAALHHCVLQDCGTGVSLWSGLLQAQHSRFACRGPAVRMCARLEGFPPGAAALPAGDSLSRLWTSVPAPVREELQRLSADLGASALGSAVNSMEQRGTKRARTSLEDANWVEPHELESPVILRSLRAVDETLYAFALHALTGQPLPPAPPGFMRFVEQLPPVALVTCCDLSALAGPVPVPFDLPPSAWARNALLPLYNTMPPEWDSIVSAAAGELASTTSTPAAPSGRGRKRAPAPVPAAAGAGGAAGSENAQQSLETHPGLMEAVAELGVSSEEMVELGLSSLDPASQPVPKRQKTAPADSQGLLVRRRGIVPVVVLEEVVPGVTSLTEGRSPSQLAAATIHVNAPASADNSTSDNAPQTQHSLRVRLFGCCTPDGTVVLAATTQKRAPLVPYLPLAASLQGRESVLHVPADAPVRALALEELTSSSFERLVSAAAAVVPPAPLRSVDDVEDPVLSESRGIIEGVALYLSSTSARGTDAPLDEQLGQEELQQLRPLILQRLAVGNRSEEHVQQAVECRRRTCVYLPAGSMPGGALKSLLTRANPRSNALAAEAVLAALDVAANYAPTSFADMDLDWSDRPGENFSSFFPPGVNPMWALSHAHLVESKKDVESKQKTKKNVPKALEGPPAPQDFEEKVEIAEFITPAPTVMRKGKQSHSGTSQKVSNQASSTQSNQKQKSTVKSQVLEEVTPVVAEVEVVAAESEKATYVTRGGRVSKAQIR